MNIILIMSGGVGKRFGASLPKQYLILNGKPVIDYVIEVAKKSKLADKIIIVRDEKYKSYSKYFSDLTIDFADNGKERYDSLKNGFDLILNKYKNTKNIIILDAVAPFIFPELIDDYFLKLKDYDAVITTQKITGGLGNINHEPLNRENYFITQSPEAFRFKKIIKYFNPNSDTQELAWQLPKNSKIYLNFNFKDNMKLTYNFELEYFQNIMKNKQVEHSFSCVPNEGFFLTDGIKNFLFRTNKEETIEWLKEVYLFYIDLTKKISISSITINQKSRYGIIFIITDNNNNQFVIKVIPPFINRYIQEKTAYKCLSNKFMCKLIDYDDYNNVLILEKINLATPANYNDNVCLTEFFNKVFQNAVKFQENKHKVFHKFYDELINKLNNCSNSTENEKKISKLLLYAKNNYEVNFNKHNLYLIHGDLRPDNILKNNVNYYAIDPIGYIAPKVFECSRYIIDDVLLNNNFSISDRLDLMFQYFSRWFNMEEIINATYIYCIFITFNSLYENENKNETNKLLTLINEISKKQKNPNIN